MLRPISANYHKNLMETISKPYAKIKWRVIDVEEGSPYVLAILALLAGPSTPA
jgi:hypothetical protein